MATDQNKKTLRSFQCRDYLYEIFEQMSGELECSVDYLINESMKQYARPPEAEAVQFHRKASDVHAEVLAPRRMR